MKNTDFASYVIKSMQEALSLGLLNGIEDAEEIKDTEEYIKSNYDFLEITCSSYKEQYICGFKY